MKKINIVSQIRKVGITTIVTVPLLVSSSLFFSPVNAEITTTTTTPANITTTTSKESVNSEKNSLTKISDIKSRADKEIDRRVTSMKDLINRINSIVKLTQSQKNDFVSTLQTNISSLSSLRVKIDGDTDIATLRVDVKSVINQYRIFAVLEPQIMIMKTSDIIDNSIPKFTTFAAKLNTRIQSAQASGKNVSALVTAYTDVQSKISDASAQSKNAYALVVNLTPANYPVNTVMQSARTDLKTGFADLKLARADIQTIIDGLKLLNTSSRASITPTVR